ncbi:D-alanyl-D-alanine carboxypeptidase [Roseobacter denitrificans]|uniref:D-alanyl-D-alanine carboxypeptidase family protein n=1 Tax=Roseobacter denitrificans (strain ATCC 33942 / OCh 114) TaxID=375451 RepID=Q16AR9_ROSDO|nr:D-alanyl-D-alanine carboxypeptidase family protein [Roseobacter denitrificans]ABG30924.1 D-alanyl-D-alanine carboxypeptidase family protein [Roseobacter denitrificans OCh 114]AVL54016.1 D-alanyl-D-alanine carboxypeptidase [Roseobacter denitrificans]SFG14089.1 D-alanyl-D-alanine carboxypeptidase [Roseobacter denitrificans OCh 114]
MKVRRTWPARYGLYAFAVLWMLVILPLTAAAAPYAAFVMDARTGEVLHSRNADTRLHPASLTKMMTLYIAFQAVENGEISLDTKVKISRFAAAEPPSKLGLKSGQRIAFRYLIRAAAIKSANDAATAIGEALEGSEAAFARRMNRTAKELGMTRTTFKNAHGLTESGHMSTARDMSLLGRHVLYDYPEYYNLFSRRSTHAGVRDVANTNRRLLAAYRGADGIKTGYTRAAGFNLVASAERGQERIIATVFGGTSTIARNKRVAELLDMGFKRAPSRATVRKPKKPSYFATRHQGTRDATIMTASLRPQIRPLVAAVESPVNAEDIIAAVEQAKTSTASIASTTGILNSDIKSALIEAQETPSTGSAVPIGGVAPVSIRPAMRPTDLINASLDQSAETEVVTRLSTSGGRQWGVNVGQFGSRYLAERALLTTALTEMETLDGTLRKVVRRSSGFDANFLGMTEDSADLACRRLQARNITCKTVGPS